MLNISSKGRFATRIMVYLARRRDGLPARKQDIAEAEDISGDYVEQILIKLKTAGLVRSHRGVNGGFSLARDANQITVADVLTATEGSFDLAPCEKNKCKRAPLCPTRALWQSASEMIRGTFANTTIGDLARQANSLQGGGAGDYEI